MIHNHSVYDTDLHFIIDPITRTITSKCGKVKLMQYDHNSERFTFELPRLIEAHDMSLCNVAEVHYVNKKSGITGAKRLDVYPVDDLQVSPDSEDVVICSWLISQNATMYAGSLEFLLRFACVDEDSAEITYQWFTDIYDVTKIEEGMYNVAVVTDNDSSDTLYAWKQEMLAMVEERLNITLDEVTTITNDAIARVEQTKEEALAEVGALVDGVAGDAESAKVAASNAADSESNAKVSETNAATYMEIASSAATNASSSETNAATSEANAKQSEENAAASETVAVENAELAKDYSKLSKSYAVGDSGIRDGEDTDNSKYYSEVAQDMYSESLTLLNECEQSLVDINDRAIGTEFTLNYETGNLEYISPLYYFTVNTDSGNLEWSTDAPSSDTIEAATATTTEIEEMLNEVLYG